MNKRININRLILICIVFLAVVVIDYGCTFTVRAAEVAFVRAESSDQSSETIIRVGKTVDDNAYKIENESSVIPDIEQTEDVAQPVKEPTASSGEFVQPSIQPTPASENPVKTHEHSWVAITETIHHEAEGHYENVKTSDAWDEQVCVKKAWDENVCIQEAWDENVCIQEAWDETIYGVHAFCSTCHLDYTANGYSNEQMDAHENAHLDQFLADWAAVGYVQEYTISPYQCDFIYEWYAAWGPDARSGWHDEYVIESVIHHDAVYQTVHHDAVYQTVHHEAEFETLHHEAVYENKWIVDKPAWDETVTTGYRCSGCGETK